MFFKNIMRPAFATEGAGQAKFTKPKNTAFTYDAGASETDDFGSFSQGAQGGAPRRTKPTGNNKKKKNNFFNSLSPKALIIGASAIVALILIIVVVVVVAVANSGGDITYTNNSYVSYCDEDGTYHVVANGKVVGSYENAVDLIPSADRSFAYIVENIDGEGYDVSYVKGSKEPVSMTSNPVTEVLAYASLSPAVVYYEEDNGISLYTERYGEDGIIRTSDIVDYDSIKNTFHISADASTAVYNKLEDKEDGTLAAYLCVFTAGNDEVKFKKNMTPVEISNDGSVIYAAQQKESGTALYAIPYNDSNDRCLITDKFTSIVDINTKGNEVVYTSVGTDGKVSTYIAAFNLKKLSDEISTTKFTKDGIYKPFSVDGNVAMFETFKNTYFKYDSMSVDTTAANQCPIFVVGKDYSIEKISNYDGQFSPNGNYFYYINDKGILMQKNLKSSGSAEKISDGIVDFAVTKKGNLYWLDDADKLLYYNVSKEKTQRIETQVTYISMHKYSNTLYFSIEDSSVVYTTSEGSDKKAVKFGTSDVTSIPAFNDDNAKAAYAAFYYEEQGTWELFYTSNGKTFKTRVASCDEIGGFAGSQKYKEILDNIVNKTGNTVNDAVTDTETETEGTEAE